MNKPETLIIHHTGVSTGLPQIKAVDRYHRDSGFSKSERGYYVGYHFFIERDGYLTQTRNENEGGAHTVGWNQKSIGVCLAGNFDSELPTTIQIEVLKALIKKYGLRYQFHRESQLNRSCPGKNLSRDTIEPKDFRAPTHDDHVKAAEISRRLNLPYHIVLEFIKKLKG